MVGGTKSCLESNLIPTNDAQRAQTKPCVQQDPKNPETDPELPWSVWESPAEACANCGLPWGQGLCLQQIWDLRHVAYTLLVEVTISPTIEPLSR